MVSSTLCMKVQSVILAFLPPFRPSSCRLATHDSCSPQDAAGVAGVICNSNRRVEVGDLSRAPRDADAEHPARMRVVGATCRSPAPGRGAFAVASFQGL